MQWNNLLVHCEYVLLSLVNKEPIGQKLGRQRLRTKESSGKKESEVTRRLREKQDEHAMLKKGITTWRSVDKKIMGEFKL